MGYILYYCIGWQKYDGGYNLPSILRYGSDNLCGCYF